MARASVKKELSDVDPQRVIGVAGKMVGNEK
jgi:hypothetical protein